MFRNGQSKEIQDKYLEKLINAGYTTTKSLIDANTASLMTVLGVDLDTAEKLYVRALKNHMKSVQLEHEGKGPEGIVKPLSEIGYMTVHDISEANPARIAKTLKISLASAAEIVMYAMDLSIQEEKRQAKKTLTREERAEKLLSRERGEIIEEKQSKKMDQKEIEEIKRNIQNIISLPAREQEVTQKQRESIREKIEDFLYRFPACVGVLMYNKRGGGVLKVAQNQRVEQVLDSIHELLPNLYWKICLILENRDFYGWIESGDHLVWVQAIRDNSPREQVAYTLIFVFEKQTKENVGTATPIIEKVSLEIQQLIFQNEKEEETID
jgi:hypothetical protein